MTGKMKLCAMTKGGSGNPCFQFFFLEYRNTILNKGRNFCVYSCIITVVENTLFI